MFERKAFKKTAFPRKLYFSIIETKFLPVKHGSKVRSLCPLAFLGNWLLSATAVWQIAIAVKTTVAIAIKQTARATIAIVAIEATIFLNLWIYVSLVSGNLTACSLTNVAGISESLPPNLPLEQQY
jgi:hypothetical protein